MDRSLFVGISREAFAAGAKEDAIKSFAIDPVFDDFCLDKYLPENVRAKICDDLTERGRNQLLTIWSSATKPDDDNGRLRICDVCVKGGVLARQLSAIPHQVRWMHLRTWFGDNGCGQIQRLRTALNNGSSSSSSSSSSNTPSPLDPLCTGSEFLCCPMPTANDLRDEVKTFLKMSTDLPLFDNSTSLFVISPTVIHPIRCTRCGVPRHMSTSPVCPFHAKNRVLRAALAIPRQERPSLFRVALGDGFCRRNLVHLMFLTDCLARCPPEDFGTAYLPIVGDGVHLLTHVIHAQAVTAWLKLRAVASPCMLCGLNGCAPTKAECLMRADSPTRKAIESLDAAGAVTAIRYALGDRLAAVHLSRFLIVCSKAASQKVLKRSLESLLADESADAVSEESLQMYKRMRATFAAVRRDIELEAEEKAQRLNNSTLAAPIVK